jgi:hypothetical protein
MMISVCLRHAGHAAGLRRTAAPASSVDWAAVSALADSHEILLGLSAVWSRCRLTWILVASSSRGPRRTARLSRSIALCHLRRAEPSQPALRREPSRQRVGDMLRAKHEAHHGTECQSRYDSDKKQTRNRRLSRVA